MGFTYFKDFKENKNLNWSNITREERYFCSHLYHFLIGRENEFVDWLKNKLDLNLPTQVEWEVSYEVCFYRDFYKKIRDETAPPKIIKRTFDLCLFSESHILIIEAKVQQGFKSSQLDFFKNDVKRVGKLVGKKVEVVPILLCAKQYIDSPKTVKWLEKFPDFNLINWVDLYNKFKQDVFMDAERMYNH